MGIAAAVAGSAVLGAGASLYGSSKASSAASKAASSNNALQSEIYGENKATLSPYVQSGNAATEQLRRLLGLGDSNTGTAGDPYTAQDQQAGAISAFKDSAPYKAEFQQGQDAVTASLGAKGLLDSGAAQKSLLSYGDTFLSGKLDTYENQLAALGGQGLTAASAQAGVGTNYANATSANNNNAANAAGGAALTGANSINSALNSGLSAYSFNSALGSSYGSSGSGGTTTSSGVYDPTSEFV